jgi:hypothetical protein
MKISSSEQPSLDYSPARHHIASASASAAVFHDEDLRVADVGVVNVNTGVALPTDTVIPVG